MPDLVAKGLCPPHIPQSQQHGYLDQYLQIDLFNDPGMGQRPAPQLDKFMFQPVPLLAALRDFNTTEAVQVLVLRIRHIPITSVQLANVLPLPTLPQPQAEKCVQSPIR